MIESAFEVVSMAAKMKVLECRSALHQNRGNHMERTMLTLLVIRTHHHDSVFVSQCMYMNCSGCASLSASESLIASKYFSQYGGGRIAGSGPRRLRSSMSQISIRNDGMRQYVIVCGYIRDDVPWPRIRLRRSAVRSVGRERRTKSVMRLL